MTEQSNHASTVYLFGAGVTKAMNGNAPLNNELLPMMLTDLPEDSTRIIEFLCEVYPSTQDFLKKLRPDACRIDQGMRELTIAVLKNALPPMEDVLSLLDDALLHNRPLCEHHKTREDVAQTRNALVYGITKLIAKRLDDDPKPEGYDKCNLNFKSFFRNLPANSTIITTNYDMTVDQRIRKSRTNVDYGFTPRLRLDTDSSETLPYDKTCSILKLHGSLNWIYCPYCNAIDVCYESKLVLEIFKEKPRCCTGYPTGSVYKHKYRPMLIAPTMLKSYDIPVFPMIWDKAEEALAYADHLVIAGYSLPDADIQLRTRLTRALIRNRESRGANGNHIKITVVDRPGDELRDKKYARRHFTRLLGRKIDYQAIGFEEYVVRFMNEHVSIPS